MNINIFKNISNSISWRKELQTNLFGTLGGTGVANGAEILQQLDQQLNHGVPPSIELIFVEHHLEEAWYSNLGRCFRCLSLLALCYHTTCFHTL